jgi:hypothetical protein
VIVIVRCAGRAVCADDKEALELMTLIEEPMLRYVVL